MQLSQIQIANQERRDHHTAESLSSHASDSFISRSESPSDTADKGKRDLCCLALETHNQNEGRSLPRQFVPIKLGGNTREWPWNALPGNGVVGMAWEWPGNDLGMA